MSSCRSIPCFLKNWLLVATLASGIDFLRNSLLVLTLASGTDFLLELASGAVSFFLLSGDCCLLLVLLALAYQVEVTCCLLSSGYLSKIIAAKYQILTPNLVMFQSSKSGLIVRRNWLAVLGRATMLSSLALDASFCLPIKISFLIFCCGFIISIFCLSNKILILLF